MITYETRIESLAEVNHKKRYGEIEEVLSDMGEGTAKEIAVKMFQMGYIPTSERNFTAPRLTELERNGKVEVTGKKTCGYTGKTVAVYRWCEDA